MTLTAPHPVIHTEKGLVIDTARLSGNAYVSARMRPEPNVPATRCRLPLVHPRNCDHTYTLCMTARCLNSWSLDYQLFLIRTGGGRRIAEQFHMWGDKVGLVGAVSARPIHPQFDPFDDQYDLAPYDGDDSDNLDSDAVRVGTPPDAAPVSAV